VNEVFLILTPLLVAVMVYRNGQELREAILFPKIFREKELWRDMVIAYRRLKKWLTA